MPLSGSVAGHAAAPAGPARHEHDNQGFAVLFPPGPPVAGISLAAAEVDFDIADQPRPPSTSSWATPATVAAAGRIEVHPARRGDRRRPAGRLRGGRPSAPAASSAGAARATTASITLPLMATIEAQRRRRSPAPCSAR